jgi:hypothetical protein
MTSAKRGEYTNDSNAAGSLSCYPHAFTIRNHDWQNMKKITKAYTLSYVLRKNRLNHELIAREISPAEYYNEYYDERLINDFCHRHGHWASWNSFYKIEEGYFKPAITHKERNLTQITICAISGLVCKTCFEFKSNWGKYNIDESWIDAFEKIETRNQLAQFIKLARKKAVDLKRYECECCKNEREQMERMRKYEEVVTKHVKSVEERNEYDASYTPKPKWLYVMKCESTGFYKIGVSVDPSLRERTLQSEKPTVKLVAKWNDAQEWESHWHEYFKQCRMRGEWFKLTKCQVAFLCSTMKNRNKSEKDAHVLI